MAGKKRNYSQLYDGLKRISDEEGVDFGIDAMSKDEFKKKYFTGPGNIENLYNNLSRISDEEGIDFGQGSRDEWLESFGFRKNPNGRSYTNLQGKHVGRPTQAQPQQQYSQRVESAHDAPTNVAPHYKDRAQIAREMGETAKPTTLSPEERQAMARQTQGLVDASGRNVARGKAYLQGLMQKPTFDTEPVKIGVKTNPNVVKQSSFNPETAEMEDTYLTQAGEFESEAMADFTQDEVDAAKKTNIERIDEQIAKLEAEKQRRSGAGGLPKGWGTAMYQAGMGVPHDNKEDNDIDIALSDLRQAKTMYERNKQLHDSSDFLGGVGLPLTKDFFNNWKNFSFGVWDTLHDVGLYDFGVSDMAKAGAYNRIKNKLDKGEELSDHETDIAVAGMLLSAAQSETDLPLAYKTGEITANMAPFMAQMSANPASGLGKGLARKAVRKFGRDGIGAVAARVSARIGGNLAEAAVLSNTLQAGNVAADAMRRATGDTFINDENGEIKLGHYESDEEGNPVFVEGGEDMALYKAEVSSLIENFTELGAGGSINKLLGKAATSNIGTKLGLSRINDFVKRMGTTDFAKATKRFMEKTHWDGMIEEPLEEEYGIILNSLLVGDNKLSDLFDSEQQAEIFAGTMWFGGFMAAMNTAAYPISRRRMKNNLSKADTRGQFELGEDWEGWKERIDNMGDSEVKGLLYGIREDEQLTEAQKNAIFDYTIRLKQYQGSNVAGMLMRIENNVPQDDAAIEDAYEQGASIEDAADKNKAKELYDLRLQTATEVLGEDVVEMLDDNPIPTLLRLRERGEEAEIRAALDYVNAKYAYDGMIDRVQDDIDVAQQQADYMIRRRTNFTTLGEPTIIPVITQQDKRMYITDGYVAALEDGSIDLQNSIDDLIAVDEDGNVTFLSAKDIKTVEEQIDPAQALAETRNNIAQELSRKEADEIDGVLPFAPNDTYQGADEQGIIRSVTILQDNQDGNVTVSIDGSQPVAYPKQTIQSWVDNARMAGLQQEEAERLAQYEPAEEYDNGQGAGTEEYEPVEDYDDADNGQYAGEYEQPFEGVTPEEAQAEAEQYQANRPAMEKIPVLQDAEGNPILNKKGRPQYLWAQAPVETTADALSDLNDGMLVDARDTAQSMKKQADEKLQKVKAQKVKGDDPIEQAESRREIRTQIQEAQAEVEYWKDVTTEINRRMSAESARIQAEAEAKKTAEQKEQERKERERAEQEAQPLSLADIQKVTDEEKDEEQYANRIEVVDLPTWETTETPNGTEYHERVIVDGKHNVLKVDAPNENGDYTGSYYIYDSKRFGDIREVVDYIDSKLQEIARAEQETDTNPTDKQKEAGNYKKGHVKIDGYDITIENPKGSKRSGTEKNGNKWEVTMNNTYGYIRGTEGVDGDHVDVFLSDNPTQGNVYVVDQVKEDGSFDEHKVMYGFNSEQEAREAYLANYSKGWKGLGTITGVSKDEFKKWINSSHRKTKPFADYKSVNTEQPQEQPQATKPPKSKYDSDEEVRTFDVANFDKEGAKDLIKTAEVVVKEDEANEQAETAKEVIKGNVKNGEKPNKKGEKPLKPTKNNVSSQSGQLDLFAEVEAQDKPQEPKEEGELEGDSAEQQERARQEHDFVGDIAEAIIIKANEGNDAVSMREVKAMLDNYPLLQGYSTTDIQELVELAMTKVTRTTASHFAQGNREQRKKGYDKIVSQYMAQPLLNARDSTRVERQQYSTPTPFGYLMGVFTSIGRKVSSVLEPSAGNGALTIAFKPSIVHVNDIDERRVTNLRKLRYGKVTTQNGLLPFNEKADAILTNPPFGTVTERQYDGGIFKSTSLEGQMAINALDSMKDDGRGAIIIGGHTEYRENGVMKPKDMAFFSYLYSHYNVVDVINVSGDMYARNGTKYPVRIILIDGRKKPSGETFTIADRVIPPVKSKARAEQVTTFDELFNRIEDDILRIQQSNGPADSDSKPGREDNAAVSGGSAADGNRPSVGNGQQPVQASGVPQTRPSQLADVSTEPDRGGDGTRPTKEPTTAMDNGNGGNAVGNPGTQLTGSNPNKGNTGRTGGNERTGNAVGNNPNGGRLSVSINDEKVAYPNRSQSGTLMSVVPANQAEAINKSLETIGDVDQFLVDELGYSSKDELFSKLAAEQIDSVALAITQMNNGNGFIIGDMTGVGKGRQGAALIRYAVAHGKIPIYFTQKSALFSDNYRDLRDIGSGDLRPFIIASSSEANMTDEQGNVIHRMPSKKEQERVFDYINKYGKLPKEYDYVITTYSQIQTGTEDYEVDSKGDITPKPRTGKKAKPNAAALSGQRKRNALKKLAKGNIAILDESHTVGGDGGGAMFMQYMLKDIGGVTFLSATFAKRADNMPIYAMKTDISANGISQAELIDAIQKGGVTLQEIMSRQLVESGQMIRRERSFQGVTIDWMPVSEEQDEVQRRQFDEVADIFSQIRAFQDDFIKPQVNEMSDEIAETGSFAGIQKGTEALGVKNAPFASKMYNLVNQLLFALKADAVADRVIWNLKNGFKPVISFTNTMEGFLGELPSNVPMDEAPDFSITLLRALDGVMRISTTDVDGNTVPGIIPLSDLSEEGQARYQEIRQRILNLSSGLPISPMDAIRMKIEEAGYTVREITGRGTELAKTDDGRYIVRNRQEKDKKAAARGFNDGSVDVLMVNKSGSTGISLHSSVKFADQRQRVMVFAQFQSDINDEVQMRGRIDRTGQKFRGKYEYIVSSIPAEQRLQMMFKSKLKSLDANTTSSQKSKFNEMQVVDFLNKYGDEVVWDYMREHPELEEKLGDPLELLKGDESVKKNDSGSKKDGCASKIARYLPFLPVEEQEVIFKEITDSYAVKMQLLNDAGENDLEITTMPLNAETKSRRIWKKGVAPNSGNAFADNTYLEEAEVDVLRKPMKADEVKAYAERLSEGKPYDEWMEAKKAEIRQYFDEKKQSITERMTKSATTRAEKARDKYIKSATKYREQGKNEFTDEEISKLAQAAYNEVMAEENKKIDAQTSKFDKRYTEIVRYMEDFTPLKMLIVPVNLNDQQGDFIPSFGTFIGFKFNRDFSMSASTAVFATLDGRRKVELPLNNDRPLRAISMNSTMQSYVLRGKSMDDWDAKSPSKTRKTAYIVTGNLLQALVDIDKCSKAKGQLVEFTMKDGTVRQGILMPDNFKAEDLKNSVGINTMLQDIIDGKLVESENKEVQIGKNWYGFVLRVPKSTSKGAKYFQNSKLRNLVQHREFETKGNWMEATIINSGDLKKVLDILTKDLNVTVLKASNLEDAETRFRIDDEQSTATRTTMQTIRQAVNDIIDKLHIADRVTVLETTEGLQGKKARAKGWFDVSTGKIVVVLPNNRNAADAMRTVLHEAVAHFGLRELFGKEFNNFLMDVYSNASESVRRRINASAARRGWDIREATEEYLASLAETQDFEEARKQGIWNKVKEWFNAMLGKVGIPKLFTTSYDDNELRYILWRSWRNLTEGGNRDYIGMAEDIVKREELGVGTAASEGVVFSEQNGLPKDEIERRVGAELNTRNYNNIRKINPFLAFLWGGKISEMVDYRDVFKKPSLEDYYVSTKAEFKSIGAEPKDDSPESLIEAERENRTRWGKMKTSGMYDFHQSPKSSSEYLIDRKTGDIYRFSDHWGRVSSCVWVIDNLHANNDGRSIFQIAKANIDDFKPNYSASNVANPRYGAAYRETLAKTISNYETLLDSDVRMSESARRRVENALSKYRTLLARYDDKGYTDSRYGMVYRSDEGNDIRFREDDEIEPTSDVARTVYDSIMSDRKKHVQEAWQDGMISIKEAQDAVLDTDDKPLRSYEDAYQFENHMHGISRNEAEYFERNLFKPLLRAIDTLARKSGKTANDVYRYLMLKHGLERNVVFAERDARREHEAEMAKLQSMLEDSTITDEQKAAIEKRIRLEEAKFDGLVNHIADPDVKAYYDQQLRTIGTLRANGRIDEEEYNRRMATLSNTYLHGNKDSYKWKDYSGLMAVTGAETLEEAERLANEEINDIEGLAGEETLKLWEAVNAATQWTLRKSFDSGEMTRDNYEAVRSMFRYYVPLRGWAETRASDVYDYMGGKGEVFSPVVRKAFGRMSEADNPIAYIGNMAVSAIVGGNKNLLKQHLLRFAQNHPSTLFTVSEQWYQNVGTEENPKWTAVSPDIPENATAEQIDAAIRQFNEDMAALEESGMATKKKGKLKINYQEDNARLKEHQVRVRVNGREYVIYVNGNPRVAQAINGKLRAKARENSYESSKMANINREMAQNFTSRNPAFIFSNASRDLTMAMAVVGIKESAAYNKKFYATLGRVVFTPRAVRGGALMPMLMGMYLDGKIDGYIADTRNDKDLRTFAKYFKEFMTNGGETGFTSLRDVDTFKRNMEKEYGRMNQGKADPRKLLRQMGEGFEYMNRCVEDMTRFVTFATSRQMGRSIADSVTDAKNVTLNFNRKGSGAMGNATFRNFYIFVNPAIQSLHLLWQLASDKKTRKAFTVTTLSFATAGALMPIVNAAIYALTGGDDDDYWNLPTWVRRNNICFKIPYTGSFITIPLAQEFRVFYGLGELVASALLGHPDKNVALAATEQVTDLLPISFTGAGGNLAVNLAPTLLQPIMQVNSNVDFTGKPIRKMTPFNEDEPAFQKAYRGTPSWMVKSSELINYLTGGNEHSKGWIEGELATTLYLNYANDPAVVNHILKGYFGGMYSFISGTTGLATTALSGEMPKSYEVPILNRFINIPLERTEKGSIVLGEEYYGIKREMEKYQNEIRGFERDAKTGDEKAMGIVEDMRKSDKYKHYKLTNALVNKIDDMRNKVKQIPYESARENANIVMGELYDKLRKVDALTDEEAARLTQIKDDELNEIYALPIGEMKKRLSE